MDRCAVYQLGGPKRAKSLGPLNATDIQQGILRLGIP